MEDASDTQVEAALKNAPSLVVQLLRLANSGGRPHSGHAPITSIRQALASVGSRQLMRWCCLLLYGNSPNPSLERDPLVQLVERRAGFMERAAKALTPDDGGFRQAAWLSGLLSLAYVPHGVDVETFMTDLPVGTAIRHAILEHDGELGTLLSIAEHLEEGRFETAFQQGCSLDRGFALKLPGLARNQHGGIGCRRSPEQLVNLAQCLTCTKHQRLVRSRTRCLRKCLLRGRR
jgi:EAL and modified HD-GYP domain-containing signal transduction protein